MAICGCGLPAHCSQPAVAWGIIYADLRSELNTPLAPQAMFTQSSLVREHHCYKLSPFQAHWERWHCTHFLWLVCLLTAHVGGGSYPLSYGVFLPLPLSQAFLLLVAGHMPQLPPEPFQPGPAYLFTVLGRIPLPPLRSSEHPTLFAMCLYCSFCLLLSFSFFPRVGVSLSRGLCWSGPGLSVEVLHTA
jgi:hypothetical protein